MQLWRNRRFNWSETDLSERLLRTPDLTLDKCVDITRAAEITKQGIGVLNGNAVATCHEKVKKVTKGKPYVKTSANKQSHTQNINHVNNVLNLMNTRNKRVQHMVNSVAYATK